MKSTGDRDISVLTRQTARLLRVPAACLYVHGMRVAETGAGANGEAEARQIADWAVRTGRATVLLDAAPPGAEFRFAAAVPVRNAGGESGGALLILDREPRAEFAAEDAAALADMAELAGELLRGSGTESHLREVFKHSPNAVAVSSKGKHVLANPAYAALFGYPDAAELAGVDLLNLIAPSQRDRVREINRAREAGQQAPACYETRGLRRPGIEFDIEAHVTSYARDGQRYTVATIFDVTERRQDQERLREANERLHALIQASPLPIVAFSPRGTVELWNEAAERTFGWTEAEVLHEPLPHIPDDGHAESAMVRDITLQGIGLSNVDVRRLHKDGSLIDLSVSTAPMRDHTGSVSGIMCVYVDVTERKRMEQRLHEAQKMEAIGRLAGGIAHDFNNLLTIITGYSQMLLEELSPHDGSHALVQEVQLAAARAAKLTNQLLAFSRRQIAATEPVALGDHVAKMESLLRRAIGEHVRLRTVLPADLPLINANPTQIEQVIMNLALNARDAMPTGGDLEIKLSVVDSSEATSHGALQVEPGRYVELSVQDNGQGMDPDTRTRIFEPFFTTKDQGKGTGLGLATVYGIVKQHGGYITVESAEGKGSTFRIFLPAVAGAHPARAVEESVPAERGTETVLVTEDEPALRKLVAYMLESEGYRVLEAPSANEALRIGRTYGEVIHVLLSDVVMPEMGGPELARELLSIRPEMRVGYMSGYMDQQVSQEILNRHGKFIEKPFTKGALTRFIRDILDAPAGVAQNVD